jgi:hypothetical protein
MLYATAAGTGFREGELASLQHAWFKLDHHPPHIELPARLSKNRKPVRQPIPGGLADRLRGYLAGKPAGSPVWPGTWSERGADMLRIDLDAAGVPYRVDGPDGPLYADFHSLRHSFITLLQQMGVSAKKAQALARHSDVNLTLRRYTHASLAELGEAVGTLGFLVEADSTPALLVGGLASLSRVDLERAIEGLAALATAQGALLAAFGVNGSPGRLPVLVAPPVAPTLRTAEDGDEPGRTTGAQA